MALLRPRRLLWRLWQFAALLLLVLAVAVTAYRVAPSRLPAAWTALVADQVSSFLGLSVKIGRIDLRWQVTGPVVEVRELAVLDPDGVSEMVTFEQGVIDLSVGRSLVALAPVIDAISVQGFDVRLVIQPGGARFTLGRRGEPSSYVESTRNAFLQWANRVPDLTLAGGSLSVSGLTGLEGTLDLHDLAFKLRNRSDGHLLALSGEAPGFASTLRLLVHAAPLGLGDNQLPPARAFLEGRGLDASALTRATGKPAQLAGDVDLRAWLDIRAEKIDELWAQIEGYGLRSASAPNDAMIEQLEASLYVQRTETQWRISVPELSLGWEQRNNVSIGPLAVRIDDGEGVSAQLSALPVDALHAVVAAAGKIPSPLEADLHLAAPRGELTDVRLAAGGQDGFRMSANLTDLGMDAAGRIPSLAGLSGQIFAAPGGIAVDVDSAGVAVDVPRTFREPLEFTRVAGLVSVSWSEDGWALNAADATLETEHISTRSRIGISGSPDEARPFLDIQVYFENGDAAFASRYYPVGIMKPNVVRWADQAIVAGRVPRGGIIVHGPGSAFPFRNGEGLFHVLFSVKDAVLDYRDRWPRVEGLDAIVSFRNQGLEAIGVGGTLLGTRVGPGKAVIEDLQLSDLELSVHAEADAGNLLEFVAESPLHETLGPTLDQFEITGSNMLDVSIAVPLRTKDPVTVSGAVGFSGGSVALPAWDFAVDEVHGDAGFTERGVEFRDLQARWKGNGLRVDARQDAGGTRISGRGDIDTPTLLAYAKLPDDLGIAGRSEWSVAVTVPRDAAPVRIKLDSMLRGTSVDLPAPLAKPPGEARAIGVAVALSRDQASTVELAYGPSIRASLELDGFPDAPTIGRAAVGLGGGDVTLPEADGLAVRGTLDALALEPWHGLVSGGTGGQLPPLSELDLRVNVVSTEAGDLRDVRAEFVPERWRLDLGGGVAVGEITAEKPFDSIEARLQRLSLGPLEDTDRSWPDPAELPSINLIVDEISIGGESLGRLRAGTARRQDGLDLTDFSLEGETVALTGTGSWMRRDADEAELEGVLKSPDLGRFTRGLGFDAAMHGASANIDFNLAWDDALLSPDPATMDGRFGFVIGAGRLSGIDPGLGRVLGLINLESLGRRFSGDFSDVVDEGFAFDAIEGHVTINEGDAYTHDLVVVAPAAKIDVQGRVGLAAKDYDQLVTVVPTVSGTLPIAATIAGGPFIGAAVLVAEQVVGARFDEGNKVQYTIKGAWDDPVVERLPAEVPESQRTPEELIAR